MIDLLTRIVAIDSSIITTLNQTRTSNPVNEITAISETVGSSWVDPAYDDAGNMTTGPKGTDPTTKLHFVFDAWNRMVTVKADASGSPGSTIANYTYDGRNRRITKTIGGQTYHGYYNNNWQYLETRIDSSTSSSGQVVWDLRYIDSPLALLGSTNLYYTNDANFNVTALIDGGTGAVSERSQYDPYGNVQFYTAAWATTSSSAANNPVLYCGYTFDGESGLYLARNRYLNVATGTFERRDPIDLPLAGGLYQYVGGNPLSSADPSGAIRVTLDADAYIPAAWVSIPPQPNLNWWGPFTVAAWVAGNARGPSAIPLRGASKIFSWVSMQSCTANGWNAGDGFTPGGWARVGRGRGIGVSKRFDMLANLSTKLVVAMGTHSGIESASASGCVVTARLKATGNVPLAIATVPFGIDYDYTLKVRHVGPLIFWSVTGVHDAYPAHEAYITIAGAITKFVNYTPPAGWGWSQPPFALAGGKIGPIVGPPGTWPIPVSASGIAFVREFCCCSATVSAIPIDF